jgi:hypothetical protein
MASPHGTSPSLPPLAGGSGSGSSAPEGTPTAAGASAAAPGARSSSPSSPYVSPIIPRRRLGALTGDDASSDVLSSLTLPPPIPRRRGAVSGASGPSLPFPPLGRARRGSRGPSPSGGSVDGSDELPVLAPIGIPTQRRGAIAGPATSGSTFPRHNAPPYGSSLHPFEGGPGGTSSAPPSSGAADVPFYAVSALSGPGPSASIPAAWTDLRRPSRGSAPPLDGSLGAGGPSSDSLGPSSAYAASIAASSAAAGGYAPAYSHPGPVPSMMSMSHAGYGAPRPAWAPGMSGPSHPAVMALHHGGGGGGGGDMYGAPHPYGHMMTAGGFDMSKPRPRSGPRIESDVPRNFRCQYAGCPARFQRNHDLKRHQRGHLATRPFACSCGKSFSRKDALKRHMLVKVSCAVAGIVSASDL